MSYYVANAPARRIPKVSFRRRFTPAEQVAIYERATVDPLVQIMLDDINSVMTGVLLDDQSLIDGLQYLVALGILAPERVPDLLKDGEPAEL